MDKAKLVLKNGMHTMVPISLIGGQLPPLFRHEGRVFELRHRVVSTGGNEVRGVYQEVAK